MSTQISPGDDLSKIPAGEPPNGVQPNFIDPPTLAPAIIGVSATMMFLASIFVTGRVIANARKFGWGDLSCALALILSSAYTGAVLGTAKEARHQWDLPLSFVTPGYLKLLFAQGMLVGPSIFFAKISIFLLYLQVFTVSKIYRRLIYLGILFAFLLYWTNVAIEPYFCAPHPGGAWDFSVASRCGKLTAFGVVQGILVVVLDIYIFILPIPTILGLQLPKKKKLSILFVFMTAALGIIAGFAAMVLRALLHYRPYDQNWYAAALAICIIVENFIAIIVSSMPAFAAFIRATAKESIFFSSFRSGIRQSLQFSSKSEQKVQSRVGTYPSLSAGRITQPYVKEHSYCELHEV